MIFLHWISPKNSESKSHIRLYLIPNYRKSFEVFNAEILKNCNFALNRTQNLWITRSFTSYQIIRNSLNVSYYYYYYNGLILPLYPVLCFKRDFYSVSRGSRDISVLLSLFQYFSIHFSIHLFQYSFISVFIDKEMKRK